MSLAHDSANDKNFKRNFWLQQLKVALHACIVKYKFWSHHSLWFRTQQ